MEIGTIVSAEDFQQFQNIFSASTQIALVTLDSNDNPFTQISGNTDFCKKYAPENNPEALFHAHPDMGSFTFDVVINNEKIGTVYGGQVFTKKPSEEALRVYAQEHGYDADSYIIVANKVPVVPESCLTATKSCLKFVLEQQFLNDYEQHSESGKLEGLRKEISNANSIIQTINTNTHSLKSIANKQKMLSLNASIEAARSGEAGVGFAVVAKSMGELSSQSANIYGDIERSVTEVTESIDKLSDFFTKE